MVLTLGDGKMDNNILKKLASCYNDQFHINSDLNYPKNKVSL